MSKEKGVPDFKKLGEQLKYQDGRKILERVEEEVEKTLRKKGIFIRDTWDVSAGGDLFSGEVPEALATWTTEEVGKYMLRLGNYVGFLANVTSYQKARSSILSSMLTFTSAYFAKEYRREGFNEISIKDEVVTDERYINILALYEEAKMLTIRLEAAYKEQNKNYNSVSRIITLRQEKDSRTNRRGGRFD